ncbi:MAG: NnrU family protein [Rhodospirillaceae bacterium]|nr:NnrU family protein [Rhodospirillaceae bacterium]MBT6829700.1 NnrU family protein [Rhodospirillaceae bacterium]
MTGTLWSLALALAIFIAVHMVPVVPGLRAAMINAWGKRVYRALFSILSLAGLVWIVFAHKDAPQILLWEGPDWFRLIPLAAMPLVLILLATMPSDGIKKVTHHPLLWAIFLWATAHIPTNGDAASLMLFGAFALFALIDQPLADARTRREEPEDWAEKSATSSALPFLAALQGRAKPSLKEIGYIRIAAALVLYVVILFAHEHVIGLTALPL